MSGSMKSVEDEVPSWHSSAIIKDTSKMALGTKVTQLNLSSLEKSNAQPGSVQCKHGRGMSKSVISANIADSDLRKHGSASVVSVDGVFNVEDEEQRRNSGGLVNTFAFTLFTNMCKTQMKVPITNLVLCANEKCQRKALPLNSFCVEHIGADKSQCLFQACKARHTDFSLCDATIVPSVLTSLLDNNQIYDWNQGNPNKASSSLSTANDIASTKASASNGSSSMILLCSEHRLKLEQANKLKSEALNKMTVLQKAAAKHERKLARIEKRNEKLALKRRKEMARCHKKPRVSATVRVWARRKKRKQETVIQTGGKKINNIPYRPYPDYEWRYSSSQSSSSASEFSESCGSDHQTLSIRTFSQDDEAASQTANDDCFSQAEEETKNLFDSTVNAHCNISCPENPSHPAIPPRREALTPELSDDSLQGLQLPGCFDSPMFDFYSNEDDPAFSDSCFDKYFNEFFNEVQLGHRDSFHLIEAPVVESTSPAVTLDEKAQFPNSRKSEDAVVADDSVKKPDQTETVRQHPLTVVQESEVLHKEKETELTASEKRAVESSVVEKPFHDHDYSAVSRNQVAQECLAPAHKVISIKDKQKPKSQHPNKWLRTGFMVNDKLIKSGTKVDPKNLDIKLKKDPILCQPKADVLDIVRVKFRAPVVQRGGDRFLVVPPPKRRKELAQYRVTDPCLSNSPSK